MEKNRKQYSSRRVIPLTSQNLSPYLRQIIRYIKSGSWKQVQSIFDTVDTLSDESVALAVAAMFTHLRRPIPFELVPQRKRPLATAGVDVEQLMRLMSGSTLSAASNNAYMAIRYISGVPLGRLVAKLEKANHNKAREELLCSIQSAWTQVRLWVKHIHDYMYNIFLEKDVYKHGSTALSAQSVINELAGFTQGISDIECMKSTVFADALIVDVIFSLWKKQDVGLSITLDIGGSAHAITQLMEAVIESSDYKDGVIPNLQEKAFVRTATRRIKQLLQFARNFIAIGPENQTRLFQGIAYGHDILDELSTKERFTEYVACSDVVRESINVIRYCLDRGTSEMLGHYWLKIVNVLMFLESIFDSKNGTKCIAAALEDKIYVPLAKLTLMMDEQGGEAFPDPMRSILQQLVQFSTNRTVLKLLAEAYDYTSALGPSLERNVYVGDIWKSFRSAVAEMYICMYLSDMTYNERRTACMNPKCAKLVQMNALKRCAGCKASVYCSRECHKIDWIEGNHRAVCRSFSEKKLDGEPLGLATDITRQSHFRGSLSRLHFRRYRRYILSTLSDSKAHPTISETKTVVVDVDLEYCFSDFFATLRITHRESTETEQQKLGPGVFAFVRMLLPEGQRQTTEFYIAMNDPSGDIPPSILAKCKRRYQTPLRLAVVCTDDETDDSDDDELGTEDHRADFSEIDEAVFMFRQREGFHGIRSDGSMLRDCVKRAIDCLAYERDGVGLTAIIERWKP